MAPSPSPALQSASIAAPQRAVWDPETQEEHGGQTWSQLGDRYVCDFSVTTNALGVPERALRASHAALAEISHYPAADCREALTALSDFVQYDADRMLLSNGASEFIEMLMRLAPAGGFASSPYAASYMEYDRAARAAGRDKVSSAREAGVSVVIRPNSPTGDYMPLDELRAYVESARGIVVVDESFIVFRGAEWRRESALELVDEYPQKLVVLFSWTKLWCCPGLRLGSVAASEAWITKLKKMQVPWSCNTVAQAFLRAACADTAYLHKSWRVLPQWKRAQCERVLQLGWKVNHDSADWVPWVFVTCGSAEEARRAAALAFQAGCPVRHCASFGLPQCLRLGVRAPEHQQVLQSALLALKKQP